MFMSMWSGACFALGAAGIGGAMVSGMPADPVGNAVPSGALMGAGIFFTGLGGALTALE